MALERAISFAGIPRLFPRKPVLGDADNLKETALLPDFMMDIFFTLLDYTGPVSGGDSYTLSRCRSQAVIVSSR